MNLPQVTNNLTLSNKEIDEALAKGLSPEGLLRLKAVDQTIAFSMSKNINEKQFMALVENVYQFLTIKEEVR